MKRLFSVLLVVAMLLTLCIPIGAAENQTTLLYSYGSFEGKDINAFSGAWRTFEYSEDCAKTGKVSIKAVGHIDNEPSGILWFANHNVIFEPGKTYSVRFYARAKDEEGHIEAGVYAGNNKYMTISQPRRSIPIGSWGEYVGVFKWDEDTAAGTASIRIDVSGYGDVYVDDLRIYEGALDYDKTKWQDAEYQEITPDGSTINLYVDQNATAGGDGSIESPFDTIEAARDYVRTINDSMTQNITINVKGGRYEIEDTIKLTDEDSGTNGHYVIYQPYGYDTDNKEEVILSGGRKVTDWTEAEIPGVYKAPFEIDYLRNLYVNDERAQRARYKEYVTPIDWWDDTEHSLSEKDGFIIPGGIIKNPEKATNLEIYKDVTFRSVWVVKGKAQASGDNTIIAMSQPEFAMHEYANYSILDWKITDNFILENALEFLDEPGEWYHDADTDTLYYMPREGENIESCEVVAPDTEKIMTVMGSGLEKCAENIIIRGFTFSDGAYKRTSRLGRANLQGATCYSIIVDQNNKVYGGFQGVTDGNIILTNARNVSLTDNVIKHMGGVGVSMPNGVDNCEIKGNAIYDTSSSAIIVGCNTQDTVVDWRIVPRNVHIKNNIIGNTGVEYGTDCGVMGYFTNGLVISHNEIFDTTYSGISLGWSWSATEDTKRNNVIEYNRLYNCATNCQDGGGIYTLGRHPNSAVHDNYIRINAQFIEGIYHDSGSADFRTTNNVSELPENSPGYSLYKNNNIGDNLYVANNYATSFMPEKINTAIAVSENNHNGHGAVRSPEALKIRAAAGLEEEYMYLRDKVSGYSENTQIERIYLQTEEQNHQTPANIKSGESLTLKTYQERRNGEIEIIDSGLTYSVSDSSVLKLEGKKLTAVGEGISNVSVTDASGRSAFMTVTVDDEVVSFEVSAEHNSVKPGEKVHINYRLKTKYTEVIDYPMMSEMSVDDESTVTLLSDGSVKATGNGVAKVNVNASIGGFDVSGSVSFVVTDKTYNTFTIQDYGERLQDSDIIEFFGGNGESTITEKQFVEMVAAATETSVDRIRQNPGTNTLTKENMVAIAADALVEIYGEVIGGDAELHQYTDRAQIDPALVPKIAIAYRTALLSWTDGKTTFEPKRAVTASEASEIIRRLVKPQDFEHLYEEDHYFNRYYITCGRLLYNHISQLRKLSAQWRVNKIGEESTHILHGVHAGSNGVTVDNGELVQKIVRNNAKDTTILTINNMPFESGKKYKLSYSVKLPEGVSQNTSIISQFETVSGTGKLLNQSVSAASGWTKFEMPIEIPEDVVIPETNSIYIRFWNDSTDSEVYTVYVKDLIVSEVDNMLISSSSIADGEENVAVPVDSVYLYTYDEIDAASVTADKFLITGLGATIRDAEAIDANTIRVGIDGCTNDASYTLSVIGVEGTAGGTMNDSISWTTTPVNGKTGGWDFEDSSYKVTYYSGIVSDECSTDYAYSGNSSLKLTTDNDGNLYLNTRFAGFSTFEIGKKYLISYSILSPESGFRTGFTKHDCDMSIVEIKNVSAGVWHRLSGVFEPTDESQITNDIFTISIWDEPSVCYVDNITIAELKTYPVTVCRPNIFQNGIPTNRITQGENDVEIKVKGGAEEKSVRAMIAQYDENGKLLSLAYPNQAVETIAANGEKTIKINLSVAKDAQTKIFVMDSQSFEPYTQVICMDK